eukprot:CAMPEP_0180661706 /NCGR_PEP_ID=MMETSP1037_2-20121125/58988_1 /TAXON_ID=632150 /ORGANISM="Azadinium spinosum, Strain 3D9" /LENGTH=51 /DNA_ID=CAMNT_0022689293 /DNA_START=208 /DNA_END=364 /DNA_ORIENTATION=-
MADKALEPPQRLRPQLLSRAHAQEEGTGPVARAGAAGASATEEGPAPGTEG